MATLETASGGLPVPTGPHSVGRVSYDWVDRARFDIYASNPDARRELVVFVWYPARPHPGAEFTPYLPSAWAPTAEFLGLNVAGLRSHAVPDATVADDSAAYPVLLLSPSGFAPLLLGAIAEELASHGFIVVGVNHTYEAAVTAFADGRVVPMSPAATGGPAERLTQRGLPPASIGVRIQGSRPRFGRRPVGEPQHGSDRAFHRSAGSRSVRRALTLLRRRRRPRVVPEGSAFAGRRRTWTAHCGVTWAGSGSTGQRCRCWPSTLSSP
jgi:hypothetical protein